MATTKKFRSHVCRGADAESHALATHDARGAEIGDADAPVLMDEDVLWLDVAVQEADLVDGVHGGAKVDGELDGPQGGVAVFGVGQQCREVSLLVKVGHDAEV